MVKKIKKPKSKEEKQAEKEAEALERERQAEGIQDEFQAKGKEVATSLVENRPLVLGVIAAIVVVGIGLGVYSMTQTQSNEAASKLYAEALDNWRAPVGESLPGLPEDAIRFESEKAKATKARELFQKVVDAEPGTGAASLARLYVGHANMALGDYDKALATYEGYLANTTRGDALYFAGLDGKAAAQEAKGDLKGAISTLEARRLTATKVADDAAMLTLARLHRDAGDKDAAKKILESFVSDYPESPLKKEADKILSSLKG